MRNLIDALYDQHRRMFALLDLLEREIDTFAQGNAFDFYVVEGALDYIAVYPDNLHRPIELRVYEAYRQAKGGDDTLVSKAVAAEHADLSAAAHEIKNAVQAVARNAPPPRDWLVDKARRLIDGLRRHMIHEETSILPAVRETLTDENLAAIEATIKRDRNVPAKRAEEKAFAALFRVITDQDKKGLLSA